MQASDRKGMKPGWQGRCEKLTFQIAGSCSPKSLAAEQHTQFSLQVISCNAEAENRFDSVNVITYTSQHQQSAGGFTYSYAQVVQCTNLL